MNFFRRTFFGGHTIFFASPFAQVDQFTTFAAKRTIWIAGVFDFLFASWAFHGNRVFEL